MPPGVALLEGPGGSAGASDGQLQALQEAGYLAQMQDAQASGGLSGMATGLGVAGEMMPPPGMPGDLSGIANLSNPDAGPK